MTVANYREVEAALLDAAMTTATDAERVVSLLCEDDFADPQNRAIFNAIMDVRVSAGIVEPGAVGEALVRRGRADGWVIMSGLVGRENALKIPTDSIGRAAASLKERRAKRKITELVREGGVNAVRDFLGTVKEINSSMDDGRITQEEAVEFLAMIRRNSKLATLGPPTGIVALDAATYGLVPSFYWAIGGPTSSGKTILGVQFVLQALLWGGRGAYFSAEMARRWLLARFAGAYLGISSTRIFLGRLTEREEILVEGAVAVLGELPIHTFRSVTDVFDICRKVRGLKATYGKLDVVVVDYVQKILVRGVQNMNERMAIVSGELQDLAAEVDTCVIAISQQSNEQVREKGKGGLTYRYASELSHDCDVGIEIIPPNDLLVKKNRAGPTGKIKVSMVKQYTAYSQIGSDEELEPGK